jgi:hypothetical protein
VRERKKEGGKLRERERENERKREVILEIE